MRRCLRVYNGEQTTLRSAEEGLKSKPNFSQGANIQCGHAANSDIHTETRMTPVSTFQNARCAHGPKLFLIPLLARDRHHITYYAVPFSILKP